MSSKLLVLITGANQGLGYYATQQLAARGNYHILLGSRDITKAKKAIESLSQDASVKLDTSNIEPLQIDMDSDESIQAAASQVENKHGHLDILMLNAGISNAPGTTREQFQQLYNTNVFGAAITVDAFLPLLRKSSAEGGKRIAFTSSGLASLQMALDPAKPLYAAKRYPLYRSTKTALNMLMLHYADVLGEEGFVVSASDPGYCGTNLNGFQGFKDPRDGAKALIRAATAEKGKVHAAMVTEEEKVPW